MSSPGTVRVRLRYADLDTFVQKFAPNVTRGGIFLASRTPRPPGDVFSFEVQLANGQVALSGEGRVIWVKEFSPDEPQKPHGMGVQFVRIDPGSRETLNQILSVKRPSRPTQPAVTVTRHMGGADNGRPARNGASVARAVDTTVDLAAEFGFDEATLRRAVDRTWMVGGRVDEDLEDLLKPEPVEPATLAQALIELPRLLDPARRRTGAYRTLELTGLIDKQPAARAPEPSHEEGATATPASEPTHDDSRS